MKSDKICCINHTRIEIRQVTFMLTTCLYVLHVCADELYVCVCVLRRFSPVQLCATLWTGACQAPVSLGFPRQEYWSGLPCPPPGDLPDLGIKPASLMSLALAGRFFTTSATWEARVTYLCQS